MSADAVQPATTF